MAITNHERVGKALDFLKDGLKPFVEREMKAQHAQRWFEEVRNSVSDSQVSLFATERDARWDIAAILAVMWNQWNLVFKKTLGQAERTLVSELRDVRNRWAHQNPFSTDDAYRALDSSGRLLTAVSAPQAEEIEKMKMELLRVRFEEQLRTERRKTASTTIESPTPSGVKPWREVVSPHKDVASGQYQQAEFAADLWQVHLNQGADEYRRPAEFFRRTYLTESLKGLLTNAARRVVHNSGDPVIQLQTNFGGGKTHSMLALYHLFSGTAPSELAGVDALLSEAGLNKLPRVKRVVLVGNRISPGNPVTKADGTIIRTLWGELAWQLGEKKAFKLIEADDQRATNPGDRLRELLNDYGPCLILIDEWVAYARQLHDQGDLPAGNFETQFTFAQALSESAKLAKNCLLVISLPASDTPTSPHAQADDAEVGGQRGREALERLRNVIGRVESSWRPASAEEGFEIVRRRLFEPLVEKSQFVARDNTARAFYDLYRTQQQEFPPECRVSDYEKRLLAAYPIHPEIFDRLYTDWSTLLKFQRTRGVLRLMAAVIHSLWEKGDKNPLILPANIPIDDHRVQFELTRYLSDNWIPIIEKDVDGPNSLPLRTDAEVTNLGKFAACRRVARTIYLGSAPTATAANRGLEDRRIKLGCVMPGESPQIFGDALRRLANTATYLFQDGPRYWYSTQPTVTKLAEDRAEEYRRNADAVAKLIEERLKMDLKKTGDFERVHVPAGSAQDVSDEMTARLVVLGVDHPYSKDSGNPAELAAKGILESRGNAPRLYRNALVFLAVDQTRLQDLDEAVRKFLAWKSIVSDAESGTLQLIPHQVKQAKDQRDAAEVTLKARLPEAYQWLLVPVQQTPHDAVKWEAHRLTGDEPLAVRASTKLRKESLLYTTWAGTLLRMELDKIPLWRGDHVQVRQLAEDFAQYIYLPRLKNSSILADAIRDGVRLLTWPQDAFAYADSFDETTQRYRGLRAGELIGISLDAAAGLLVKPDIAAKQIEAERAAAAVGAGNATTTAAPAGNGHSADVSPKEPNQPAASAKPKRFHGTVSLDPARVGRDASRIADEVIAHLHGLMGADVTVTLEIEAKVSSGVPDNVVRTVTENSRTLKFSNHGFEKE